MYGNKRRFETQTQKIRDERKDKVFIESIVDKFTITVQNRSYEVQLQRPLLYHPLAVGEDSLLDSKLVLVENGRGVSDFRLT
ncbi:hypothetical protein TNCV_2570371 [Trichonephila clavipes]|nr:hypothetical protein TNCV_2570371 [Trichonephila clavipes]